MEEIRELDNLTEAEIQRNRDCMTDLAKRSIAAKQQWNAQIPFRRLPEELITYIFLLACSEGGRPSAPLRISSICHDWRTVAWSASELWSSLTVCMEQEVSDIQTDLMESWLQRTKKRPLSIVVTYRSENHNVNTQWEPPAHTEALDLVLAHSEQWRSITLSVPEEWLGSLYKVHGKIPLLERLTIKGVLRFNPDVFSVTPRLRSVAFELYHDKWKELGDISLPWSQLTELSITAEDIKTCLTVVERCSSLAHLALHENVPLYQPSKPSGPTTINVTSLHISSNAKESWFIDGISAPHLKDLAVRCPRGSTHVLESVCALIARSGCAESITRFSFVGYIIPEMIWFLWKLHNLSELELDNAIHAPPFSNGFINVLHSPSTLSGLTPRRLLTNLVSFRYLGPITLHSDAFLDMLQEAKYNVGGTGSDVPQLQSVVVRGYGNVLNESGCLIQAMSLRAQELNVDMHYIGSGMSFVELHMKYLPILGSKV